MASLARAHVLACAVGILAALASPALAGGPVIDMHVHATFTERAQPVLGCTGDQVIDYPPIDPAAAGADAQTESCPRPIASETRRDEFEANTIQALRNADVRHAILIGSPETLQRWQRSAPGLFIPATVPRNFSEEQTRDLRLLQTSGTIQAFAELGLQYGGFSADDPRVDPFWSLAEERDVPVGIHLGLGMPLFGESARTDQYRAALTSPFQLEAVLKKHPGLRVYVMHAASPLTDQMIAMLYTYPSLYVDVSASDWNMPRAQFYAELKLLVDAGFAQRIMFGSDQTIWPQAIGIAVKTIEDAPFLTARQKRDILYNNAARFLRLTSAQIAADHRPR